MPVDIPADGDFGAAFGAARLGLIAAEKADPFAVCTAPATAETIEPDARARRRLFRCLSALPRALSRHQRSFVMTTGFFGDIKQGQI